MNASELLYAENRFGGTQCLHGFFVLAGFVHGFAFHAEFRNFAHFGAIEFRGFKRSIDGFHVFRT